MSFRTWVEEKENMDLNSALRVFGYKSLPTLVQLQKDKQKLFVSGANRNDLTTAYNVIARVLDPTRGGHKQFSIPGLEGMQSPVPKSYTKIERFQEAIDEMVGALREELVGIVGRDDFLGPKVTDLFNVHHGPDDNTWGVKITASRTGGIGDRLIVTFLYSEGGFYVGSRLHYDGSWYDGPKKVDEMSFENLYTYLRYRFFKYLGDVK